MVEDKLEIMADPNENQAERRAAGGTESADHAAATANGSSSNRNEAPASIDAAATPEASSTTPDTSAPEGAQGESRPGSEAARKTSADQRLKSGESRPSTLVPTKPGLETAALSKSEATPVQDAGPAPPASLLPMDFLGAGERPVDAARLPPEAPGLSAVDPKTETPPATSEEPRADPAWRIAHDRKRPAWRAGRGLPALAAALALAALLGAGWQAQRAGWLDVEAPTAAAPEAGGETLAQDAPEPASAIPEQSVEPAAAPTETSEPDTPEPIQPSIDVVRVEPDGAAVTEEPSGAQPWNLNGAELVEMERLLVRLALEPSSSDGIVDRQTKRAIRLYQQIAGLPVDGEPSRALLTDMREVVKILDSGT
jgi:peptidoglycan hydrolase-like protein with peptidoglycan-binding domain